MIEFFFFNLMSLCCLFWFIYLYSFPNNPARTCLHWACKRNHKHIVSYLLSCGADKEILTAKDELASQLTSKPEIKRLLGGKLQLLLTVIVT